ncbi:GtrA family protein [uncultured Olleya sp.]|uniref:GtrA family protein n=1 Tax=uncultured Olleya sp. TaxID=757243 RepID=UPI00338EFBFB
MKLFSHENLISPKNKKLVFRYILISIFGYGFIFGGLFILVDYFQIDKTISFVIIYGLNYIFLYSIQLKLLFKTKHNSKKLIRYISSILLFYLCANLLYNFGLKLNLKYMLSSILTVVLLMPLRFLVSKLIVFRDY